MLSNQFGPYAVIGITSFGVKCKDPTFPGVYTRVDKFIDWIETQKDLIEKIGLQNYLQSQMNDD